MEFEVMDYWVEKDIETIDRLRGRSEGEKIIAGAFKFKNKKGMFKAKLFWDMDGTSGKEIIIAPTVGDDFSDGEYDEIEELIEEWLEEGDINA